MRMSRIFAWTVACVMLFAVTAQAGIVRIEKMQEEGEDKAPMQLRSEALAEGFAQAVLDEAMPMLPGQLSPERMDALHEYLTYFAKPYIQGYKVLVSNVQPSGVVLEMDVTIDKRTLRSGLQKLGLMRTAGTSIPGAVNLPQDLDEETLGVIQKLIVMSGIAPSEGALPAFTLEPGDGKIFKARLETEDKEWMFINKNLTVVWVELWGRYFDQSDIADAASGKQHLTVSGWFSPDAVLEFDRVLTGWDSAVQDVRLVELDMQAAGVGGTWEFDLISGERLAVELNGYLPQRGLTFQLSEDSQ